MKKMALISTEQNVVKKQQRDKEKEKVCMCDDGRRGSAAHQLSSRSLQERSQTQAGAAVPCEFLRRHKHTAMVIRD